MSTYLGIDTNSFGFHVVASSPIVMPGAEGFEQQAGWCTAGSKSAQERRRLVYVTARRFFETIPAGARVFVEEPLVLTKNINTTRLLVMMGGVIEAAFMQARPDAYFFWVDVSTWRKEVLAPARGSAPRNKDGWKALAKLYVSMYFDDYPSWEQTFEQEPDLYDAACIMAYGEQVGV